MGILQIPCAILSLLLFFSLTLSQISSSNIKQWCNRTPHPSICKTYMDQSSLTVIEKSDFIKMAMMVAEDEATRAHSHIMQVHLTCQDEHAKAALTDCIELYESTIFRLNLAISHYSQYNDLDKQTWLSMALTNLDTCKIGLHELGVLENLLPIMSKDVSMISNSLAINKSPQGGPEYEIGFPNWVWDSDQRLVQIPLSHSSSTNYIVVARDGSGDFKKIKKAIRYASKRNGTERFVIYVKTGTYKENVEIGNKVKNITLVGDGIGKTIITGKKHAGGNTTTFKSATFAVTGDGFIACNITFRNTAGPRKGQAVALRSGSDFSVFYRCSFEGYQDTLYVHSNRQFYRECDIHGTVDFIFGNAAVVFQNCNIYVRKPQHKTNTITAQSRFDPNQNTGIVIQNSNVTASPDLIPVLSSVKTYLGRPWRNCSKAVFMNSYLGSLIDPSGWVKWSDESDLDTLYYGEYNNTGPGSSTVERVKWGGYHHFTNSSQVLNFTVENFLSGDSWLPSTNVPFTPGL